jgi:hypothetical protein
MIVGRQFLRQYSPGKCATPLSAQTEHPIQRAWIAAVQVKRVGFTSAKPRDIAGERNLQMQARAVVYKPAATGYAGHHPARRPTA